MIKFWNSKKPNVVVAMDGTGHFKSLHDAIQNYMPSQSQKEKEKGMYVIYIKQGTYAEGNITVRKGQDNIYMYGDGDRKTIITGNISTGLDNITTANTAIFCKLSLSLYIYTCKLTTILFFMFVSCIY